MQLGCDRGGWYSIDALDHGGEPSVAELRTEWTERCVGDTVHATPALDGGYTVSDVQPQRFHVLGAEAERMGGHIRTSWSFVLEPIGTDATRLITRVRGIGDPPWSAWLQGAVLFPPIHALMQHAQLKNLKKLAEELAWKRG
jgi:proline iminopeptidase